jgi:hypothetical protein
MGIIAKRGRNMAKPIKKNKARFTSNINFRKAGKFVAGILFFVVIIFGIYWLIQYNEPTKKTTDQGISNITESIEQNGLLPTGILVLAVGGVLYAFISNKK